MYGGRTGIKRTSALSPRGRKKASFHSATTWAMRDSRSGCVSPSVGESGCFSSFLEEARMRKAACEEAAGGRR